VHRFIWIIRSRI